MEPPVAIIRASNRCNPAPFIAPFSLLEFSETGVPDAKKQR
jgi:hypothetical protein